MCLIHLRNQGCTKTESKHLGTYFPGVKFANKTPESVNAYVSSTFLTNSSAVIALISLKIVFGGHLVSFAICAIVLGAAKSRSGILSLANAVTA